MSGAIPKGYIRPKNNEEELIGDPLDKKFLLLDVKGIQKRVGALHQGWAEVQTLAKYIAPPVDENGVFPPGAPEMWIEILENLEKGLKYLLSLPHHRFWSQVVYDPGVHACLDSYLVNVKRTFDAITDDLSGPVREFSAPLEESVHQLVLLVFIRMATFKESKESHITPAAFGDIIYEYFLFDICKILDICVLYGRTNPQLISKMVANIFSNQSKYYADLSDTIPTIRMAIDNIEEKLGVAENMLPMALSNPSRRVSIEDIHDTAVFLNDTLTSLQMFITCHPPACKYFNADNFDIRLSACYERVIPLMMEVLGDQSDNQQLKLWMTNLMKRIELSRVSILTICRLLIQHKCLEPLESTSASPTLVGECVEKFLQVMSTCIGEKTFIADYCAVYPINADLQFFRKHGGDVTSLDFITDAVSTVLSEMGLTSSVPVSKSSHENSVEKEKEKEKVVSDTSGMNGYVDSGSSVPSDIELSSLVSHVQDLLPGLGGGFIQQCLQYYGYSPEAVINAILEDNLPPSLVMLDRAAPAKLIPKPEPTPLPAVSVEEAVKKADIMERSNVYDNDEFDVFNRKEVDHSKIYKGKKENTFLNDTVDESDREKMKQIARQYEERGGTSIYEDEFRYDEDAHRTWEYDDEYDDTYDDDDVGNIDITSETVKKRPGIIGAGRLNTHINHNRPGNSEEENDSEEESTSNDVRAEKDRNSQSSVTQAGARSKNMGNKRGVQRIYTQTSSKPCISKENTPTPERDEFQERSKENFIEDPEVLRQRAAQRRQDKDAFRNRGFRGRENQTQENGYGDNSFTPRQRVSAASNKNSGKSWRQGPGPSGGGGDENRGYHGGKYKEDTNHGKAQSQSNRHKMTHKNEHKRQGAQAKFNRNN